MSSTPRENSSGRSNLVDQASYSSRRHSSAHTCCAGQNVGDKERIVSSLAGAGLAAYGLSHLRPGSLLLAGVGGALIYRGVSGRCMAYRALGIDTAHGSPATVVPAQHGAKVEQSIVIERSPAELYSFWREFDNLPRVMHHLKSVEVIDRLRSRWVADGPLGKEVEWEAEVFNDVENELIAWRSLPGGDIATAGSVRFTSLPGERGTTVTVSLKYDPPAGKVGAYVASLTGADPGKTIADDLAQFKRLMESSSTREPQQQSG
jgi:uncharacterized membrane protein